VSDARDVSHSSEVRHHLASRFGRLPTNARFILQAAAAAGSAYFLAANLLGHAQPFFAPVAAVVTLSLAPGERGRRALEVALGVVVGLVIADLVVLAVGVGAAQIALVVAAAMAAAVLIGERRLLVNQAAISAILVVVLQPPDSGFSPDRFFNALVGGGVALERDHPTADELGDEQAVGAGLGEDVDGLSAPVFANVREVVARGLPEIGDRALVADQHSRPGARGDLREGPRPHARRD